MATKEPGYFGIVPWKHHVLIASKCKSIEEAFYYLQRIIDEGLSRSELEDLVTDDAWSKQGKALTNFHQHLDEVQGALANNVLKDPYNFDFIQLQRHYDDNPTIGLLICKSKDQTKVEWAFDSIQNPMGVATYQGIKIANKLPSVEALQERIKLLEAQLEQSKG